MEKVLYKAVTEMNPQIYKDFYKFYFKKHYRTFNIVSMCISILMFALAAYFYIARFDAIWFMIALWIAIVLFIYPKFAYRRVAKRAGKSRQTTRFRFYQDHVAEKTSGEESDYKYSELQEVVEGKKYLFIFHSEDSVSIVIKSEVADNGAEKLCVLLQSNVTAYKKTNKF